MAYQDSIIFLGGTSFGLGGSTSRDTTIYYTSNNLKLDQASLPPSSIFVRENSLELLGNKILRNYLVTISWDEEKIWLRPYEDLKPQTLYPIDIKYMDGRLSSQK